MNQHEIVTVVVYDINVDDGSPPYDLGEYIAWLQAKMDSIPPEFRDAAEVDIYAGEFGSNLGYQIRYYRPKTQADRDQEAAKKAAWEVVKRVRELEQLAALKAKYENP